MSAQTRVLVKRALAEEADRVQGYEDPVFEAVNVLLSGVAGKLYRLDVLDSVLEAFMTSNVHQGRTFMLDDLLNLREKRRFLFKHLEVQYQATVKLYRGFDRNWVDIKLPNNGFEYTKVPGPKFYYHQRDGWMVLPAAEVLATFPFISTAFASRFGEAKVYYNDTAERVDIRMRPRDDNDVGVCVTYEPGEAVVNDAHHWAPLI